MKPLAEDPRHIEYRLARHDMQAGLSAPDGARNRYRDAIVPYVTLLSEHTPEDSPARKHLMRCLFYDDNLPFGVIAGIFRMTAEEAEFVKDHPPLALEPVDEIARLQRMSYTAYLQSSHWHRIRKAALERAEGRCSICNSPDQLDVHHRTYERRGCERPADVVALCRACHAVHHRSMKVVA